MGSWELDKVEYKGCIDTLMRPLSQILEAGHISLREALVRLDEI